MRAFYLFAYRKYFIDIFYHEPNKSSSLSDISECFCGFISGPIRRGEIEGESQKLNKQTNKQTKRNRNRKRFLISINLRMIELKIIVNSSIVNLFSELKSRTTLKKTKRISASFLCTGGSSVCTIRRITSTDTNNI
jgi:hypothetical protein